MPDSRVDHPLIRAYMAGVTVPAVFLLGIMFVYVLARLVWELPVPVERVIAFPMAIVPNAWGLWNMLYVGLRGERAIPLGLHGAILPWLLIPFAWEMTRTLGLDFPFGGWLIAPIAVSALYYVLWRFLVAPLNRIVGVCQTDHAAA